MQLPIGMAVIALSLVATAIGLLALAMIVRDHRQQQAWAHASLNTPRSALTIQDAAAPVLAVVTDMDVDNSSGVPIVIDDELAADDAALDFDIHFEIEMECDEPELDARSTRSTGKQTQPLRARGTTPPKMQPTAYAGALEAAITELDQQAELDEPSVIIDASAFVTKQRAITRVFGSRSSS